MEATPAPTIADRVRDFITSYVSLPADCFADMLALYTLHTHTFIMQKDDETKVVVLSPSSPRTTPYIYITSRDPGSGKTRLLELLHEIVRLPQMSAGMTGPTMFRMVESVKPTLILDEVDTIYSGAKDESLRGVLNSGYKHNGKVARVDEKSDLGFRNFSTFCPKILAGIDNGAVPNTVLDRSIKIVLVKANPGDIQPFYADDVEDLADDLKDEIQTWLAGNMDRLADRTRRPAAIPGLSDRQNDIIRPLLAIADNLSPEWSKRARVALEACFAEAATPLTPQAEALSRVRAYMVAHDLTRISSAKVSELVGQSPNQVGAWFDAFELQPKTLRGFDKEPAARVDGQSDKVKGYLKDGAMEAAWSRFLPMMNA
jgi:hypothetical protein